MTWTIGHVDLDGTRAQEWATTARETGRYSGVRVVVRTISAKGASAALWVVVVQTLIGGAR